MKDMSPELEIDERVTETLQKGEDEIFEVLPKKPRKRGLTPGTPDGGARQIQEWSENAYDACARSRAIWYNAAARAREALEVAHNTYETLEDDLRTLEEFERRRSLAAQAELREILSIGIGGHDGSGFPKRLGFSEGEWRDISEAVMRWTTDHGWEIFRRQVWDKADAAILRESLPVLCKGILQRGVIDMVGLVKLAQKPSENPLSASSMKEIRAECKRILQETDPSQDWWSTLCQVVGVNARIYHGLLRQISRQIDVAEIRHKEGKTYHPPEYLAGFFEKKGFRRKKS